MTQTVVTLISEVVPARLSAARRLIEDLKAFVETRTTASDDPYEAMISAIPDLHFASIMVFEDERYDPLLTLELNFDGPVGPFLATLETPLLAPHIRALLRCCKPPCGGTRPLFEAITRQGSKLPMAPYLETLVVKPALFHQGNRGLDRARILREADLFGTVETLIAQPPFRNAATAQALHAALRTQLLPDHAWLDAIVPERIGASERALDVAKLAGLLLALLALLLGPGFLVHRAAPELAAAVGAIVMTAATVAAAWRGWVSYRAGSTVIVRAPQLPPLPARTRGAKGLLIAVLILVFCATFPAFRAAVAGLVVIVAAVAVWLRRLETTDPVQEVPPVDEAKLRRIMALEDQISQNHMGSIVHVKGGVLRGVLIRLGLHGLGLILRVFETNGYLGDMRTIHFAHWALVDNGSRLMFFSNFDSSWESYLDDFIEKAHFGLTLAWSNGVGFPRTRFLVQEGATNGSLFKTWARHSMSESLFWFSAYRELSVNQIERNSAIAAGLRMAAPSAAAAANWAALL